MMRAGMLIARLFVMLAQCVMVGRQTVILFGQNAVMLYGSTKTHRRKRVFRAWINWCVGSFALAVYEPSTYLSG